MSTSPDRPPAIIHPLEPDLSKAAAKRQSIAILGNPNAGKSTLFNRLTGLRQKVGNYAGVTVEKKVGLSTLPSGRTVEIIDLPGTYSLRPGSPDEQIVRDVLFGLHADTPSPDLIVFVLDDSGSMADPLPGTGDAKFQWVERYVGIILKLLLARCTEVLGSTTAINNM